MEIVIIIASIYTIYTSILIYCCKNAKFISDDDTVCSGK